MPIYKEDNKYFVKICINGKQILRRKYLGRTINSFEIASQCEKDLKKNDFLFKSSFTNYKVIGETTIKRMLVYYCNKANLKVIKIHEFRHSCATFLINQDVDPKDIASRLGHSSPDITLRYYAHLLPVRKEKVKEVINKKYF